MFYNIKILWFGLINTRFNKKKSKVKRNTLNENIFEEWGKIDIDI